MSVSEGLCIRVRARHRSSPAMVLLMVECDEYRHRIIRLNSGQAALLVSGCFEWASLIVTVNGLAL